jgi:cell division protein FtsB
MPPASSASARRSPVASPLAGAALRVRWDRVGRISLLVVLLLVALAYVGPARSLLSTWHTSNASQAQLHALEREHRALLQRAQQLRDPRTVQAAARRLGMVKPGEQSYVVQNLPGG